MKHVDELRVEGPLRVHGLTITITYDRRVQGRGYCRPHGDSDAIVPFEVSGARTQRAIPGSHLSLIKGGPHGFNLSHAAKFNKNLLDFLAS